MKYAVDDLMLECDIIIIEVFHNKAHVNTHRRKERKKFMYLSL